MLLIAPCDHKAAKYAVEHWHYSQTMPRSKMNTFGVWEDGAFVGCVMFGMPATPTAASDLRSRFNITVHEMTELTRVALRLHRSPVSQIVRAAMKQVKAHSPLLRLIVSYADPEEFHHGGIYQAMNWTYCGRTAADTFYREPGGRVVHARVLNLRYGTRRADLAESKGYTLIKKAGKHRYIYPLDRAIRRQVQKLAQPYPSAVEVSTGHA